MRRLAPLVCLCLMACHATPPPDFAGTFGTDARGVIVRRDDGGGEVAAVVARGEVPRAALVTIEAVQPDGEDVALERVLRDGRWLFRATTHYAAPLPPARTVLVDAAGNVVERAFDLAWDGAPAEFATAVAALRVRLGPDPGRLELVAGADGHEWLRAHATEPDGGAQIVECDAAGVVQTSVVVPVPAPSACPPDTQSAHAPGSSAVAPKLPSPSTHLPNAGPQGALAPSARAPDTRVPSATPPGAPTPRTPPTDAPPADTPPSDTRHPGSAY